MLGFTACPVGFLSSHGEKHPDPKSGLDLAAEKNWYALCSVGEVRLTHIIPHCFFLIFVSDPQVIESVVGLVPVEQPH